MSVAVKKQPDVASMDVIPVRQLVTVTLKPGASLTPEKLRAVINAQGFATPKDPVVTARGTLDGPGAAPRPVLALEGTRRLVLEGALEPLRGLAPGTAVTVTGTLLVGKKRSDSPPTLVVTGAKIAIESQPPR